MKGVGGEKRGDITMYTVGHSNRAADEFIGLLLKNRVEVLADIRKLPGSNKQPPKGVIWSHRNLSSPQLERSGRR